MQPTYAEKRNVLLLASAQALFQTISVMVLTLSGLIGQQLATDKRLATLPIAMMMVGAAATMIPASLLMQRHGRKAGFLLGTGLGCAAGLLAALALWLHHFWLFVLANTLVGGYQGFAQYYRFAAADIASADFKSRAISWVIAGGIVAGLLGPNIGRWTQSISPLPYLAAYLVLFGLSLLAMLIVSRTHIPPMQVSQQHGPARPLLTILRQPVFLTAVIGSAVGYAVMAMVMTATPLAMQLCGQPQGASATVIQWHVLGMFIPSFFTGNLIRRFGVLPIMGLGIALLALQVVISLSGIGFLHFLSGLILLGVGWNFLFIGGTNLLTESYQPSERAKTQAAHDFLMFGLVSLASLSAGGLLNTWGWQSVNLTVLPFLALALLAVLGLGIKRRGRLQLS
ncbi:MFS transporter [Leeia aquatica]|uniref:MFS transporter n=1 Tax=Leeia aquatica TaxID=2725557 RepID=A0A847RWK8_9NEIS|nr:MFS transporter [Leeia aquatica]NLR74181.1 MFS transporter [Leeia aquatica]